MVQYVSEIYIVESLQKSGLSRKSHLKKDSYIVSLLIPYEIIDEVISYLPRGPVANTPINELTNS